MTSLCHCEDPATQHLSSWGRSNLLVRLFGIAWGRGDGVALSSDETATLALLARGDKKGTGQPRCDKGELGQPRGDKEGQSGLAVTMEGDCFATLAMTKGGLAMTSGVLAVTGGGGAMTIRLSFQTKRLHCLCEDPATQHVRKKHLNTQLLST